MSTTQKRWLFAILVGFGLFVLNIAAWSLLASMLLVAGIPSALLTVIGFFEGYAVVYFLILPLTMQMGRGE